MNVIDQRKQQIAHSAGSSSNLSSSNSNSSDVNSLDSMEHENIHHKNVPRSRQMPANAVMLPHVANRKNLMINNVARNAGGNAAVGGGDSMSYLGPFNFRQLLRPTQGPTNSLRKRKGFDLALTPSPCWSSPSAMLWSEYASLAFYRQIMNKQNRMFKIVSIEINCVGKTSVVSICK